MNALLLLNTCIFSYFGTVCVHVAKEGKTSLLIAVCYYFYLWLSPITQMYSHEKKSKKELLERNEAKKDNLEVFKVVHHL